jgi:hypothetical protein
MPSFQLRSVELGDKRARSGSNAAVRSGGGDRATDDRIWQSHSVALEAQIPALDLVQCDTVSSTSCRAVTSVVRLLAGRRGREQRRRLGAWDDQERMRRRSAVLIRDGRRGGTVSGHLELRPLQQASPGRSGRRPRMDGARPAAAPRPFQHLSRRRATVSSSELPVLVFARSTNAITTDELCCIRPASRSLSRGQAERAAWS